MRRGHFWFGVLVGVGATWAYHAVKGLPKPGSNGG
jgi:hypothetical protein